MFDTLIAQLELLSASWRLADLLDIGVVALLLYFSLTWLQRRASRPILVTIGVVVLLWIVSRALNMYLTLTLSQVGIPFILLALILIFQEDIRQAFERMAGWNFLRWQPRLTASYRIIDTIVLATAEFADDRTGAIVVVKGREPLDRHIRGGVSIDGAVSIPLLQSIFQRQAPRHDGAVILEDGRLESFGAILPLSRSLPAIGAPGTRHAAALGLAERSDAFVIVVSEERGAISVATQGELESIASPTELKARLEQFFQQTFPASTPGAWPRRLTRNLPAKVTSVAVALMLWLVFAFQIETIERTYLVPIEYRNVPANYSLDEMRPIQARVMLSGPQRSFNLLDPAALVISVDASDIREGFQELVVNDRDLSHPRDLTIDQIQPRVLGLNAYALQTVELPVRVRTRGRLPEHLMLVDTQAAPSRVRAMVRRKDRREPPPAIRTEIIDLDEIRQTTVMDSQMILPDHTRLISPETGTVRVTVTVAERSVAENADK